MDPELAAIARLSPRLDISDIDRARELDRKSWRDQLPPGALDRWERQVDWSDDVIELPDGRTTECRVYRPHSTDALSPAVIFIHGGGFIIGAIDQEHPRCLRYAADAGCIVVSLEYRLAPEFPYPAGLDDCYWGTAAVFDRAAELGIDRHRVAVAGVSAGASLAAGVALRARETAAFQFAFQLLVCPALDDRMTTPSMAEYVDEPIWDSTRTRQMWDYYLGSDRELVDGFAAPARTDDLAGLPPTYLLVAEMDPLRDEGLDYGTRLVQAGVSTEIHLFAGTFHTFDGHIGPEVSERAMAEQITALKVALRP